MRLWVIVCASFFSVGATAIAQTGQHPPATVTLDASDFITVLTWAFSFLALFLIVIAALGVAFFGFDIRNARSSIDKEMAELRKLFAEAKALKEELEKTSKRQQETQNDLEQIGAKIEEAADQSSPVSKTDSETRNLPDLIREVLRNSRFEWTTIGTVAKRTGLSRDDVLHLVQSMSDVRIGTGKRSQDIIFRFKRDDEL